MIPRLVLVLAMVAGALWLPVRASAHALEPGYLELIPLGGDQWRATWRKPQVQGRPMPIDAVLPEGCAPRRAPPPDFDGRAFVAGWIATCAEGIAGGEIRIDGLERTRTDVLVRYSLRPDRSARAMRLTPPAPAFAVPADPSAFGVFASYFALGVDHILKGLDHLLFVFALLLLIRRWRPLLGAVTAFTLAHSVTLAAASLGWIVIPAPPVEAIVALSIAFLASELARPADGASRLGERHPWAVAFAFGLLHGLGFARALTEVGLPEGEVPLALLSFNLGVEAGQIAFIAVALALGAALTRIYPALCARLARPGSGGLRAVSYAIGILAAYWVAERVAGFAA